MSARIHDSPSSSLMAAPPNSSPVVFKVSRPVCKPADAAVTRQTFGGLVICDIKQNYNYSRKTGENHQHRLLLFSKLVW